MHIPLVVVTGSEERCHTFSISTAGVQSACLGVHHSTSRAPPAAAGRDAAAESRGSVRAVAKYVCSLLRRSWGGGGMSWSGYHLFIAAAAWPSCTTSSSSPARGEAPALEGGYFLRGLMQPAPEEALWPLLLSVQLANPRVPIVLVFRRPHVTPPPPSPSNVAACRRTQLGKSATAARLKAEQLFLRGGLCRAVNPTTDAGLLLRALLHREQARSRLTAFVDVFSPERDAWTERWLVLQQHALLIFAVVDSKGNDAARGEDAHMVRVRERIDLTPASHATAVGQREWQLYSQERVYTFRCADSTEMLVWLAAVVNRDVIMSENMLLALPDASIAANAAFNFLTRTAAFVADASTNFSGFLRQGGMRDVLLQYARRRGLHSHIHAWMFMASYEVAHPEGDGTLPDVEACVGDAQAQVQAHSTTAPSAFGAPPPTAVLPGVRPAELSALFRGAATTMPSDSGRRASSSSGARANKPSISHADAACAAAQAHVVWEQYCTPEHLAAWGVPEQCWSLVHWEVTRAVAQSRRGGGGSGSGSGGGGASAAGTSGSARASLSPLTRMSISEDEASWDWLSVPPEEAPVHVLPRNVFFSIRQRVERFIAAAIVLPFCAEYLHRVRQRPHEAVPAAKKPAPRRMTLIPKRRDTSAPAPVSRPRLMSHAVDAHAQAHQPSARAHESAARHSVLSSTPLTTVHDVSALAASAVALVPKGGAPSRFSSVESWMSALHQHVSTSTLGLIVPAASLLYRDRSVSSYRMSGTSMHMAAPLISSSLTPDTEAMRLSPPVSSSIPRSASVEHRMWSRDTSLERTASAASASSSVGGLSVESMPAPTPFVPIWEASSPKVGGRAAGKTAFNHRGSMGSVSRSMGEGATLDGIRPAGFPSSLSSALRVDGLVAVSSSNSGSGNGSGGGGDTAGQSVPWALPGFQAVLADVAAVAQTRWLTKWELALGVQRTPVCTQRFSARDAFTRPLLPTNSAQACDAYLPKAEQALSFSRPDAARGVVLTSVLLHRLQEAQIPPTILARVRQVHHTGDHSSAATAGSVRLQLWHDLWASAGRDAVAFGSSEASSSLRSLLGGTYTPQVHRIVQLQAVNAVLDSVQLRRVAHIESTAAAIARSLVSISGPVTTVTPLSAPPPPQVVGRGVEELQSLPNMSHSGEGDAACLPLPPATKLCVRVANERLRSSLSAWWLGERRALAMRMPAPVDTSVEGAHNSISVAAQCMQTASRILAAPRASSTMLAAVGVLDDDSDSDASLHSNNDTASCSSPHALLVHMQASVTAAASISQVGASMSRMLDVNVEELSLPYSSLVAPVLSTLPPPPSSIAPRAAPPPPQRGIVARLDLPSHVQQPSGVAPSHDECAAFLHVRRQWITRLSAVVAPPLRALAQAPSLHVPALRGTQGSARGLELGGRESWRQPAGGRSRPLPPPPPPPPPAAPTHFSAREFEHVFGCRRLAPLPAHLLVPAQLTQRPRDAANEASGGVPAHANPYAAAHNGKEVDVGASMFKSMLQWGCVDFADMLLMPDDAELLQRARQDCRPWQGVSAALNGDASGALPNKDKRGGAPVGAEGGLESPTAVMCSPCIKRVAGAAASSSGSETPSARVMKSPSKMFTGLRVKKISSSSGGGGGGGSGGSTGDGSGATGVCGGHQKLQIMAVGMALVIPRALWHRVANPASVGRLPLLPVTHVRHAQVHAAVHLKLRASACPSSGATKQLLVQQRSLSLVPARVSHETAGVPPDVSMSSEGSGYAPRSLATRNSSAATQPSSPLFGAAAAAQPAPTTRELGSTLSPVPRTRKGSAVQMADIDAGGGSLLTLAMASVDARRSVATPSGASPFSLPADARRILASPTGASSSGSTGLTPTAASTVASMTRASLRRSMSTNNTLLLTATPRSSTVLPTSPTAAAMSFLSPLLEASREVTVGAERSRFEGTRRSFAFESSSSPAARLRSGAQEASATYGGPGASGRSATGAPLPSTSTVQALPAVRAETSTLPLIPVPVLFAGWARIRWLNHSGLATWSSSFTGGGGGKRTAQWSTVTTDGGLSAGANPTAASPAAVASPGVRLRTGAGVASPVGRDSIRMSRSFSVNLVFDVDDDASFDTPVAAAACVRQDVLVEADYDAALASLVTAMHHRPTAATVESASALSPLRSSPEASAEGSEGRITSLGASSSRSKRRGTLADSVLFGRMLDEAAPALSRSGSARRKSIFHAHTQVRGARAAPASTAATLGVPSLSGRALTYAAPRVAHTFSSAVNDGAAMEYGSAAAAEHGAPATRNRTMSFDPSLPPALAPRAKWQVVEWGAGSGVPPSRAVLHPPPAATAADVVDGGDGGVCEGVLSTATWPLAYVCMYADGSLCVSHQFVDTSLSSFLAYTRACAAAPMSVATLSPYVGGLHLSAAYDVSPTRSTSAPAHALDILLQHGVFSLLPCQAPLSASWLAAMRLATVAPVCAADTGTMMAASPSTFPLLRSFQGKVSSGDFLKHTNPVQMALGALDASHMPLLEFQGEKRGKVRRNWKTRIFRVTLASKQNAPSGGAGTASSVLALARRQQPRVAALMEQASKQGVPLALMLKSLQLPSSAMSSEVHALDAVRAWNVVMTDTLCPGWLQLMVASGYSALHTQHQRVFAFITSGLQAPLSPAWLSNAFANVPLCVLALQQRVVLPPPLPPPSSAGAASLGMVTSIMPGAASAGFATRPQWEPRMHSAYHHLVAFMTKLSEYDVSCTYNKRTLVGEAVKGSFSVVAGGKSRVLRAQMKLAKGSTASGGSAATSPASLASPSWHADDSSRTRATSFGEALSAGSRGDAGNAGRVGSGQRAEGGGDEKGGSGLRRLLSRKRIDDGAGMQVADKFGRTPDSSRSPSAESGTRFEFGIVTADRTWEVAVAQYATLTASLSTLNTFRISRVDAMSHQFARLADKPYVEVSRTEAARSGAAASDGASHQTCSLPLEWLIPPTFTFGAA